MSESVTEPRSVLGGADFRGLVRVTEAGPTGMITIRADLSDAAVKAALKTALGRAVPRKRAIVAAGEGVRVAWMSPDELMVFCDNAAREALQTRISAALSGHHHLVADVSDARVVFRLEGAAVRDVLAKLTPADLRPGALGTGEMRRTRLLQVAGAFWLDDAATAHVIAFRSVAAYVFDLLCVAADPDAGVGYFPA